MVQCVCSWCVLVCAHSFVLSEQSLHGVYNVMIPKEFSWQCCDPKVEIIGSAGVRVEGVESGESCFVFGDLFLWLSKELIFSFSSFYYTMLDRPPCVCV